MRQLLRLMIVLAFACPAFAQYTTITASTITDAGGSPLSSGVIHFQPNDGAGKKIGFQLPNGGQGLPISVDCNVVNGAIAGSVNGGVCRLADTSQTNPQNICYGVTITDNTSGQQVQGTGYECIQPAPTVNWCSTYNTIVTCNFDLYVPPTTTLPVTATGPTGPQGTAGPGFVGFVEATALQGPDLGAKIQSADTILGSSPGTITIGLPGTISTAFTLSAGHNLQISAPIAMNATGTLTNQNKVYCTGGAAALITSTIGVSAPPNFIAANGGLFIAADGAQQTTIDGCSVKSPYGILLYSATYTISTTLRNNHLDHTTLFYQDYHTTIDKPGRGLTAQGNTVDFGTDYGSTPADIFISQYFDGANMVGNHFFGGVSGFEAFGSDAQTNPSYMQIRTSMLQNFLFSGNDCHGMAATCAWGSGMWRAHFVGNTADGCGDICFDLEGSANSLIATNTAYNFVNGAFCPAYFTSFHNSVIGNTAVSTKDVPTILIKNASTLAGNVDGLFLSSNNITYVGVIGAWIHSETSFHTFISGNDVTDGRIDNVQPMLDSTMDGNHLFFDIPAGSSTFGGNAGLDIGWAYKSFLKVTGNTITTLVAQPASTACMQQNNKDLNSTNQYVIQRNECMGPWTQGIVLTSGVSTVTWTIRDNTLPTLTIPQSGPGTLIRTNNCLLTSTVCN